MERQLHAALRRCQAPAVLLDIHAAQVPLAAPQMLVRTRLLAQRRGIFLCVIARQPRLAETLRAEGLESVLRVTRTLDEARARAGTGCPAVRPPASPKAGTRLKARLYRLICSDAVTGRQPAMTVRHP
ncbi:hypothetical protein GCM10023220_49250 [Streptomyces ziwulingensis]|uniref:STAS domain-containing protein n=1 Tax=Streptomyces ziwulingensis TaxID=1045501 RepID=A0ABP9CIS2_9ACTN